MGRVISFVTFVIQIRLFLLLSASFLTDTGFVAIPVIEWSSSFAGSVRTGFGKVMLTSIICLILRTSTIMASGPDGLGNHKAVARLACAQFKIMGASGRSRLRLVDQSPTKSPIRWQLNQPKADNDTSPLSVSMDPTISVDYFAWQLSIPEQSIEQ